jgi:hypothetical protein
VLALVIIGLGFLPGVMAPSRPFTAVVHVDQGQGGRQTPFEEDHHRVDDADLRVHAAKLRKARASSLDPVLRARELEAFLASLRPSWKLDAVNPPPPDAPDDLGLKLRLMLLPRRTAEPPDDPSIA